MKTSKVIIVDPANLSPYYNYPYVKSLADEGLDAELLTSKFLYEDIRPPKNITINFYFFKVVVFLNRWLKSQTVRRVIRAIEYPFNLISLFVRLLREKPKIIHYNWMAIPTLDLLFLKLLKSIRIKIVYTAHNHFPHELKPWHKWQYGKIYNSVDHIITLTEYVKKTILENTSLKSENITVIPHGNFHYILSQFEPNIELKSDLEKKIAGCKVVSFCGIIRPYKGLEYLLQAFAIVRKRIPNVKLCVFGRCSLTNQNIFIEQASKLKLEDSVIFDFRYIPWSDLQAYLDMTHLVVLPYISASQSGNVVMLYDKGIPVVVSDAGGLPEMVVNGKSGIIVQSKNVFALAEGIIDILKDEGKRRQMSKFASDLAEREYSWKKIAQQTIQEVYFKL